MPSATTGMGGGGGRADSHTVHLSALPGFSHVHAAQRHGGGGSVPGRRVPHVPHDVPVPVLGTVHAAHTHSSTSTASAGFAELHTGHVST